MTRKTWWMAGGWLLVAVVVYLSLSPQPPEVLPFSASDKFKHCLAYGSLSLWFCQIYVRVRQRAAVVAVLIAVGIMLEFVQGWSGYRTFEIADMVANGIGAVLGLILAHTPLGRSLLWFEKILR